MTQPDLATWLQRKPSQKKPRKPLRRVAKKRAKHLREYSARVKVWLIEHPVCEVWCRENGWQWASYSELLGARYTRISAPYYLIDFCAKSLFANGAPSATQCHHMNKRRGVRLLDESYWLAVCDENHKRIENNKAWARANGYLLNF